MWCLIFCPEHLHAGQTSERSKRKVPTHGQRAVTEQSAPPTKNTPKQERNRSNQLHHKSKKDMCCRFLAVGVLIVLGIYAAVVVTLKLTLPECLEEPCYSEGVDDTILTWGLDFFLAFVMIGFASHLMLCIPEAKAVRTAGIMAQLMMSGFFTFSGFLHQQFANNAYGDGRGMRGFWWLWMCATFMFTGSALSHAQFSHDATDYVSKLQRPCCGDSLLALFQCILAMAGLTNMLAGLWCSFDTSLHVEELMDEFEVNENHKNLATAPGCVKMVAISEIVLFLSYSLLWIPVGMLLQSAARQKPEIILGLTTPTAAGTIILLQWTVGAMYYVYIPLTAWIRDSDFLEVYRDAHGSIIFHCGMVLSFYLSHNLSWSLPSPKRLLAFHAAANNISTKNRRNARVDTKDEEQGRGR